MRNSRVIECASNGGQTSVGNCELNIAITKAQHAIDPNKGYEYLQQYAQLMQSRCGKCAIYNNRLDYVLRQLDSLLSQV